MYPRACHSRKERREGREVSHGKQISMQSCAPTSRVLAVIGRHDEGIAPTIQNLAVKVTGRAPKLLAGLRACLVANRFVQGIILQCVSEIPGSERGQPNTDAAFGTIQTQFASVFRKSVLFADEI